MNWYKKSQINNIKEPWEMTKEEYKSIPNPSLKPTKEFNVNNIRVIQNPSSSDIRQLTKEVREERPWISSDTPKLRSTQDQYGNTYYWKAYDAVHSQIEPFLSKIVGAELDQNASKPLYNRLIYNALKEGKPVPENIKNKFLKRYPNIF